MTYNTNTSSTNPLSSLGFEGSDTELIQLLEWSDRISALLEPLVCVAGMIVGPDCKDCGIARLESQQLNREEADVLREAGLQYLYVALYLDHDIELDLDELFSAELMDKVCTYAREAGAPMAAPPIGTR